MTLHLAGSRGDALRVRVAGSDVLSLAVVGTIPGVVPLAAAGANGPGTGRLRSIGDGMKLQWRAPGSETWGAAIDVADGSYLLEDGEDLAAWLRVLVRTSFLVAGPAEAQVLLGDTFNALGPDDVTAAEASAGATETLELACVNVGAHRMDGLVAWLDAATVGLELSADGAAWSAPTSEGAGIALGQVNPSASVALFVRRTVGAGASSDAEILNQIHFAWTGA